MWVTNIMMNIKGNKAGNFSTYHPIVNFTYFAAVIGIGMFSMHPVFLAATFIFAFVYSCMLGGMRAFKYNVGFLIPILVLMAIINPLFVHRGKTVLFFMNGNPMTLESIIYGIAAAAMLTGVIAWFSCFNIIITSDKFIYLFGRIIPVMSLALSVCLRFIPMLKLQFNEISEGQKNLGRDFRKQGLLKRMRQLTKNISILISWSMENAVEMSNSMRARGYGLKGRSSFSIFRFDKRDSAALAIIVLLSLIVAYGCHMGENNILYYPAVVFNPVTPRFIVTVSAYYVLLAVPVIIDIKGELTWKLLNSGI